MPEVNAQNGQAKVHTLSDELLRNMISAIFGPSATSDTTAGGRFVKLHDKIKSRGLHYHNDPSVDPKIAAPYDKGDKFQSDILRRVNTRLLSKQVENKPIVKVVPGSVLQTVKDKADDFELVMNRILSQVQERERIDIQSALHHAANTLAYGIVHWVMAPDVWPKVPDYKYSDTAGDNREFRDYPEPDAVSEDGQLPGKARFRETDTALQARTLQDRVKAGAPWFMECPHPMQFGFIEDRSQSNGMAMALLRRKVPLIDYREKLYNDTKLRLSLHDIDAKISIYEEREAPRDDSPSGSYDLLAWGKVVYVVEVWTRDEYYELASGLENGQDWTVIKSFKHPYTMPPFALAIGVENPDPDLAYKFEPLLTGIYRVKPYYDKARTLADIIAEMIALPLYYITLQDGRMHTENGKPLFLTRNALAAQVLPPGSKLEKIEYNLNPAVNEWIASLRQEMEDAAPSSGTAEISASTEPWAIRLQQAEANIEIRPSIQNVAQAYRTMVRNMAYVMSLTAEEGGFGEPVAVHGVTKEGALDKTVIISVKPEDIPQFELEISIDSHSSAERITMEQHGLDMLGNPNSLLTRREYAEAYAGKPDGRRAVLEKDAEQIWLERIKPAVLEQELARSYDNFIVLGAEGRFVGMDGQEILPEEVLARNGQQSVPTSEQLPPEASQLTMGGMPTLMAPGAQAIQGPPM